MKANHIKLNDEETERKTLHLMMNNEEAIDICLENDLQNIDFSLPLHGSIYNALSYIYFNERYGGSSVYNDMNLVLEHIMCDDEDDKRQTMLILNKIRNMKDINIKLIKPYVIKLKDYTFMRDTVVGMNAITDYLYRTEFPSKEKLIELIDDKLYYIDDETYEEKDMSEVLRDTVSEMIEDSNKESSIKFNIEDIDLNASILKGYLTYIAGSTGIGKSTIAVYLARNIANNGGNVLLVSTENKNTDCAKKIMSACLGIDYTRLVNSNKMSNDDWTLVKDMVVNKELNDLGIFWIGNDVTLDIPKLQKSIIKNVRKHDIDVVIIDYYQHIKWDEYENLHEGVEIPKVSAALQRLAGKLYKDTKGKNKLISIVAMSQLVKEIIYRDDKHPTVDDLYYGGSKDARLVLGLYRDDYYYKDESVKPNILEIGILKQNMGIENVWFDTFFDVNNQDIRELTDDEKSIIIESKENDEDEDI